METGPASVIEARPVTLLRPSPREPPQFIRGAARSSATFAVVPAVRPRASSRPATSAAYGTTGCVHAIARAPLESGAGVDAITRARTYSSSPRIV